MNSVIVFFQWLPFLLRKWVLMFIMNIKLNFKKLYHSNHIISSKILIFLKSCIIGTYKNKQYFWKIKRTQETNNDASVSYTMSIAHESNYSDSNRSSSYQNKVQSPIKKTSLVIENTPPQSCVSLMDMDEENSTYDEQNDTSNNKRQTKCKDTMQQISSSSSIVSNNSSTQTNHFRYFKSGFHQRVLNTSPAKNSFENIYIGKSFFKI